MESCAAGAGSVPRRAGAGEMRFGGCRVCVCDRSQLLVRAWIVPLACP